MRPKGRRPKYRIVSKEPKISQFSPRGKPGRPDEIDLKIDQFEALRLADFEGKGQKEAAQAMHISQQTFSRILKKARKTVAEGLVHGKIIRIQGGYYVVSTRQNEQIK
jgi:predicted DNA-binding protein (UPF0251 family)